MDVAKRGNDDFLEDCETKETKFQIIEIWGRK
jgi:hypothetical protein